MRYLDAVVRKSLTSFTNAVFDNKQWGTEGWQGMEREAVSLFAFGHLVPQCQPGSVLFHPAQIGIEVRVSKPGALGKKATTEVSKKELRICKDLILWSKPGTTWRDRVHPLAVMEWKANQPQVAEGDVNWLKKLSAECAEFTGYAVCLDMKRRNFRMSCTRVTDGQAQSGWLVL